MRERPEHGVEIAARHLPFGDTMRPVEQNEEIGQVFGRHRDARRGENEGAGCRRPEDRRQPMH